MCDVNATFFLNVAILPLWWCRKVGGKLENRRKLLIVKLSERRFAAAEKSLRHGASHGIFVAHSIFRRGLIRSSGGCGPLSHPSLHRGDGRGRSGSADWRQRALAGRRGRKISRQIRRQRAEHRHKISVFLVSAPISGKTTGASMPPGGGACDGPSVTASRSKE